MKSVAPFWREGKTKNKGWTLEMKVTRIGRRDRTESNSFYD